MRFRISLFYPGVLLICTLILNTTAIAQLSTEQQLANLKNVTPPSPNASGLGRYGEWPVSLYTGVPSIGIPIYELKGRSVSVPISLSYHAAGNKVGDIASWVGLGWSLQAGGLITRSMRGLPDEQGYFATSGSYSNPDDLSSTAPTNVSIPKLVASANGAGDTEEDIYSFSALGKSFKLVLKADGTVLTIPYSKIKVTRNPIVGTSTLTTDNSWTALMEDGTQLVFGTAGYTETTDNPGFTSTEATGISYISSWYLKSVTSATGEVINFNYTPVEIEQDSYFSQSDYIKYRTGSNAAAYCTVLNQSSTVNTIVNKLGVYSLLPVSIESDLTRVEFITDPAPRTDLMGGKALSELKVYSKLSGRYVEDYVFNHSYTQAVGSNAYTDDIINNSGVDYWGNRLRLNSLERKNILDNTLPSQKWTFDYNSQNLPSRRSYAQDHWGFFNGATDNRTLLPPEDFPNPGDPDLTGTGFFPPYHELGANRNGNENFMQAEILTAIHYPTGGNSTFSYEANSVTTTEELFGPTGLNFQLSLSAGQTNVFSQSGTFTITKAQTISLQLGSVITESILHDQPDATGVAIIKNPDGSQLGALTSNGSDYDGSTSFYVNPGTYTLTVLTTVDQSSLGTNLDHASVYGAVGYNGSLGIQTYNKPVGGLRIQHIADFDGIVPTPINDHYFQYSDPLVINPIDPVDDYISTQTSHTYDQSTGAQCYYLKTIRNSSTKYALGSIEGGTVGYGTVTTLYGPNAENGKKVSVFSSEADIGTDAAKIFPYPMANSMEVKRGLLLHETDYNASSAIVHETVNTYDFPFIIEITGFKAGYSYLEDPFWCTDQYRNCGISFSYSSTRILQVRYLSSVDTRYDPSGQNPFTLTTNYFYDNANNLQPTRTEITDSKGSIIKTINRTPLEKTDINTATPLSANASAAIDLLLSRNIINQVLQHEKYNGTTLLNRSLTNYKAWDANILAPENVSLQNGANALEIRLQLTGYDASGNLMEQLKAGDVKNDYIYDYQNTYPVASIVGADMLSVAYTSFEADGSGNWTIGGTARVSDAITGKQSYDISNGAITKTALDATKTYKISYWAKPGASVTVSGAASNVQILQRNGWNYWEATISGVTSTTLSGTGVIDELRLYPQGAQMTTFTYDPLVGMIGQCDVNNRVTYYEYDGFNRLSLVRDQDKNILKKICYSYAGDQYSCSLTPAFQATGQTRCKVCPSNSNYTTNIQQIEQRDVNPNSPTYNQTQWIDNGVNGSCVINSDWQNTTTAVRCKQSTANANTGEQEQEQKDMNPCSSTYNQTRWTVVGTNTTACPLPFVYVRLTYENQVDNFADIVVHFYSDAAGTNAVSVSNLTLNLQDDTYDDLSGDTQHHYYTYTGNGTATTLLASAVLIERIIEAGVTANIYHTYFLNSGDGYQIIN